MTYDEVKQAFPYCLKKRWPVFSLLASYSGIRIQMERRTQDKYFYSRYHTVETSSDDLEVLQYLLILEDIPFQKMAGYKVVVKCGATQFGYLPVCLSIILKDKAHRIVYTFTFEKKGEANA